MLDQMLIQVILNALFLGGIYSLVSIGLTLIWGTMKIINFSHGSLMMVSMYISFWLWSIIDLDPLISIFIIFPLMYGIGYLFQRFIVMPILEAERHAQLLMTFGLMLVIKNTVLYVWRADYRIVLPFYADLFFRMGEIVFDAPRVIAFAAAIAFSIGLHFFMTKTSIGMAIRAVAQDSEAASAMGINVYKIYGITCGLGTAFAGVAGVLISTYYPVHPDVGTPFMFMAFVIMVLGSMGNYLGALVAGLIIGVTEGITAYLLSSSLRQAVAFIVFILTLLLKPEGLFGRVLRR